jgi:putative transposase
MTNDRIALRELLEKGSDAGFLHAMTGFAAQRLMELEVGEVTGRRRPWRAQPRAAGGAQIP